MKTHTAHRIAYFRAEVYKQRKNMENFHFVLVVVKILITLLHACKILQCNLIDNLDCFKHTLNSNMDAYHGK